MEAGGARGLKRSIVLGLAAGGASPYLVIEAALPLLAEGASIVNITSGERPVRFRAWRQAQCRWRHLSRSLHV